MSRHFLAKLFVILLILASGLVFTLTIYQSSADGLAQFEYHQSPAFLEAMASYYNKVIQVYPPDADVSSPNMALKAELDATQGYDYVLVKNEKVLASSIPNATSESDLYNLSTASRRFEGSVPDEYWVIGMDRNTFNAGANAWHQAWLTQHTSEILRLTTTVLIMILGLIYLAFMAGRRPGSDDLHFLVVDRMFTDVGLVVWIGLQVLLTVLMLPFLRFVTDEWTIVMFPAIAAYLVLTGLMAIFSWMVFWKRIKSRSLFKHSLMAYILRGTVGKVWRHTVNAVSKVRSGPVNRLPLLLSLGFLVVNVFTIILGALLSAWLGLFGFLVGGFIYMCGIALLFIYQLYQDQMFERLEKGISIIEAGDLGHQLPAEGSPRIKRIASGINGITTGYQHAVDNALKSERMKTELITNVSHDLKTPLTAIISYVDLLKREGLDAPDAPHYLEILDQKSQRLKALTEDLFDAAKTASGNIQVNFETLSLQEFLQQTAGEVGERLSAANLDLRINMPQEPMMIQADGRHLWRVMENLYLNVLNYAMPGSRVYLDLTSSQDSAMITLKNISASPLSVSAESLMERFVRGDSARTSEGSGLGLAIARGLTELQNGHFSIETDGDLFKAMVSLPLT